MQHLQTAAAAALAPPLSRPAPSSFVGNRGRHAASVARRRNPARVQAAGAPAPGDETPRPSQQPPPSGAAGELGQQYQRAAGDELHLSSSLIEEVPPEGPVMTPERPDRGKPVAGKLEADPRYTPIHTWETKCTACGGTGMARNFPSHHGGAHHLATCLQCQGLGFVRHTTSHPEAVPQGQGAGQGQAAGSGRRFEKHYGPQEDPSKLRGFKGNPFDKPKP